MIGFLPGTITHTTDRHVILDVGGVGYLVSVTNDLLARGTALAGEISLFVHTVVREDALELYGFESEDELMFFKLLITVSGIGPKGALGILNVAPLDTLYSSIQSGDTTHLTSVSGVGKKSAEKIVLELRDKLPKMSTPMSDAAMQEDVDVLEALQALGYSQTEARSAVKSVSPETTGTGERIAEALRHLGGTK